MSHEVVLVMMLAVPLAGGLVAAGAGARQRASGAGLTVAAAAGSVSVIAATYSAVSVAAWGATTVAVGDRAVLRFDELAAFVAPVIGLVATTVLFYARRNLDGDRLAHRFAAGACLLLAGSLVTVTAATFGVLVVGWVAASLATVVLCGYRGGAEGRATAWIAGRALAVGDLALVGAFVMTVAVLGDPSLTGLDRDAAELAGTTVMSFGPLSLDAATVVALLLVVPALARAGQAPLPRWLSSTVAAPTPVSALLHAGAVNAGAVLLVRTSPVAARAWGVMVLLAACALLNVAIGVAALRARPDRKGQLAESTGAQMAFMLLAFAVGAPAVALTHLAGHALYKSARFMGAGDSIRRQARRRRWLVVARRPDRIASVVAGGCAAGAWWALSGSAGLPAAERWLVGAALTAVVTQAVLKLRSGGAPVRPLLAVTGGAVAASAGVALVADRLLGPVLVHTGSFADARAALLGLVLVAIGTALLWQSPTAAAWVVGLRVVGTPRPRPRPMPASVPWPTERRVAGASSAPALVPDLEGGR